MANKHLPKPARAYLAARGLSDTDAQRHRMAYIEASGFQGLPRLRIPYFDLQGRAVDFYRERILGASKQRFTQPAGRSPRLFLSPAVKWSVVAKDAGVEVYITEGEVKAACACKRGIPTIGLGGVDNWRESSTRLPISDFDLFLWRGRPVVLVYDSDWDTNANIRGAEYRLASELRRRGALVRVVRLPAGGNGAKQGLDDYLVAHGAKAFGKLPRVEPIQIERNTDYGNAQRLVALHGSDLRYVALGWHVWDGSRWRLDPSGSEVMRRAKDTVRHMYDAASHDTSEERRKKLAAWALASENGQRLREMIRLAESEPGIAATADDFDRDTWLFNVQNGTIDLRTGKLHAPRREDLITRQAPVHFDPKAKCPRWLAFLERILAGDRELIGFLQRAAGSTLSGETMDKALFFMYGAGGNNGKSTFIETVGALCGDYAHKTRAEVFMAHKRDGESASPARMKLRGARLVFASELSDQQRFDDAFIKDVTGGIDRLSARDLHKPVIEFKPQFKLWLYGNHKPQMRGDDAALWSRVHVIPFEVSIPKAEQERRLPDQLAAERSGILNWLLAGCLAWQRDGLRPPPRVMAATAEYRDEMDVVGQFLEEHCKSTKNPKEYAKLSVLYDRYQHWCRHAGVGAIKKSKLVNRLRDRGHRTDIGRSNVRVVVGLALRVIGRAPEAG
ncbi:MAG TPA: phage/plasmid primase, P4 family [Burkholderiales bacterium]